LTSDSLLPWEGIAEITEALRLKAGDTLLDLACGRGVYGLEIARQTNARLIGVDFAESAVQAARALAASRGQDADFRGRGALASPALPHARTVIARDHRNQKSFGTILFGVARFGRV
jgi:ribosomal protein L11 methylase PrmA